MNAKKPYHPQHGAIWLAVPPNSETVPSWERLVSLQQVRNSGWSLRINTLP